MKKILVLCLALILCVALVGCKNNDDVVIDDGPVVDNQENDNLDGNEDLPDEDLGDEEFEDEMPEVDPNSAAGIVLDLITKGNIQVNAPWYEEIPMEMTEAYIGLTSGDFEAYVTESVFYESMISPANQSFCLIKVNDTSKVEELKQKIFDNCNPRKWVCMTAERVIVLNSGEYIMLAMASQDSCNSLIPAFEAKFGAENCGTILDKTVSESIENFEDLPGGGSMAL